ncbi:MAG: AMP-binding protein [Prevotella sp.]|nr:AMP-binding protein [Bacteroides sp.]MCM1366786.1 AMP-binding protein [Prevotella sp.]MCM1436453.1 AMP-binding protein [Prevotella sp.]
MAYLRIEEKSLNAIIEKSIKNNWELEALSDLGGANYQYKDVAEQIAKLHILFDAAGVGVGDKVALCGKNSANWAIGFIACLTKGVVAVPILHEFKPEMIHHLVSHSDAKLLFTDAAIWENLDEKEMPGLEAVLFMSEFGMPFSRNSNLTDVRNRINEEFGKRYPYSFTAKDLDYYKDEPEDLALINYTSGSTGMSKGVMLPYRSIWSNIKYCIENLSFLKPGDGMVNMLPLAHLYGMVIEMLHPFCKGCHCYFLTRVPSPKIILAAFAEVKPKLVITVPLILEKIIRKKIFPMLDKPLMKILLRIPFVDDHLLMKVKAGLEQAFGGNLQEIIIGGAALNPEVEEFLQRIKFPYTVGYGMTECGPLLTYSEPKDSKPHSVGRIVERMECKVDSPDPVNIPGNLWVRGVNVMQGYYKNEAATKEVMPNSDGWMNTGDMCRVEEDGSVYICGRSKTMILGPSGQNIYPEEIEAKLNTLPYVSESLIIDNGGKLEALIYPDFDSARQENIDREELEKIMGQNISTLNKDMPSYSKVSGYKLFDTEFEKTPKRSIKRFLYQP